MAMTQTIDIAQNQHSEIFHDEEHRQGDLGSFLHLERETGHNVCACCPAGHQLPGIAQGLPSCSEEQLRA